MAVTEEDEAFAELMDAIDDEVAPHVRQIATDFANASTCETVSDARANLKSLREAAVEIMKCITEDGEVAS